MADARGTSERGRPPAGLPPVPAEPQEWWGRPLAVATAVVFVISSAFPVTAGLAENRAAFPAWWGPLDVGIAFLLAFLAIAVIMAAGRTVPPTAETASYRAYRILIHGVLALLVVFFMVGDRINWNSCLPGFAWRGWLLGYSLPAWFTLLGAGRPAPPPAAVAG